MTYTAVDFVADQLKAAAPEAEWDAAGHDRSKELAQILVRNGVIELARLQLIEVIESNRLSVWETPIETTGLGFSYRGRIFGFMGTPDRADSTKQLQVASNGSILAAWSAVGHGHIDYKVVPNNGGFAIVPSWGSSSDAGGFREGVVFLASVVVMFALPAAGIAVAQTLGAAVIGPTLAASYPALASAVGSVALGTLFSGGDIEGAVKMAALAYIGGQAGELARAGSAAVTDSQLIGKLAASGARAFAQGGDVKRAVAFTLLQNGGDAVDFFDSGNVQPQSEFSFGMQNDFYADPGLLVGGSGIGAQISTPFSFVPDAWNFGGPFETKLNPVSLSPPVEKASDSGASSFATARNLIITAGAAIQTVLQARAAFDRSKIVVNSQARTVNPQAGTVVSVLDDGTIQTRDANGQLLSTSRPAVGDARATVSGNYLLNNGDGSYTLIYPDGSQKRIQYGADSGSDLPPAWMIAAGVSIGAIVLMSLMKKGR